MHLPEKEHPVASLKHKVTPNCEPQNLQPYKPYPLSPLLANAKLSLQAERIHPKPIDVTPTKAYSYVPSYEPSPKIQAPKYSNIIDRKNFRDSAQQQIAPTYQNSRIIGLIAKSRLKNVEHSTGPVSEGIKSPIYNSYSQAKTPVEEEDLPEGCYKPYTLRDYQEISMQKYTLLGGLGPNTGGEEWKAKKKGKAISIYFLPCSIVIILFIYLFF